MARQRWLGAIATKSSSTSTRAMAASVAGTKTGTAWHAGTANASQRGTVKFSVAAVLGHGGTTAIADWSKAMSWGLIRTLIGLALIAWGFLDQNHIGAVIFGFCLVGGWPVTRALLRGIFD